PPVPAAASADLDQWFEPGQRALGGRPRVCLRHVSHAVRLDEVTDRRLPAALRRARPARATPGSLRLPRAVPHGRDRRAGRGGGRAVAVVPAPPSPPAVQRPARLRLATGSG